MRVLILGGDGMLGHQLLLTLQHHFEARVTLRQAKDAYNNYSIFNSNNSFFGVNVCRDNDLIPVLSDFKPDALINAIGLVKQRNIASEVFPNLEINALLPHRLAFLCQKHKIRFIHISTDCVFSGRKGHYTEQDISDAEDFYGRSKFLGEVNYSHCLTLRTSFIGLELSRKTSLLEWFLAQKGEIKGYTRAIYTGLTTLEMSKVIASVLTKHPDLTGVWHLASEPISKYQLLSNLKELLQRDDIKINPENEFFCNRSLEGKAFTEKTGYRIPNWNSMLKELVKQIEQRNS